MKISEYTQEYRKEKWNALLKECSSSGLTKTRWCKENNISVKSLYYWQHKLKSEKICALAGKHDIVPIQPIHEVPETDAITIECSGLSMKLPVSTSAELLTSIIKVLKC